MLLEEFKWKKEVLESDEPVLVVDLSIFVSVDCRKKIRVRWIEPDKER